MDTKVCGKCKIDKDVCFFGKNKQTKSGYRSTCNDCRREESKKYREKNPEKRKETIQKYNDNNKDIINKKNKKRYLLNPEKNKLIKLKSYHKNKEKNKEKLKLYRIKNRDKRTEYQKNKINNDELYRLSSAMRSRLRNFLKIKNWSKDNKTFDLVGCPTKYLREHLEKQFKDGMCWDNYGFNGWHIDHIIPLSSAKNIEEINKLCHYSNLQPLWAQENLSKGGKRWFN